MASNQKRNLEEIKNTLICFDWLYISKFGNFNYGAE